MSAAPQLKIFDWQSARRDSTSTDSRRPTAAGSLHLDLFGDQQSLLYMAPEAIAGMAHDAPKLDVFALGAVAYHIFSGQGPATTIEALHQKCYQGRGLRLSEVMDGAGQDLQEPSSSAPRPTSRIVWTAYATSSTCSKPSK
jgi:hypothetical protein